MFRMVHRPYPAQKRWMCELKHYSLFAQPQWRIVIYAALCWSRVIYAASIIYEPFSTNPLIELGRRPPFWADIMLPLTWGRPQPLQGWF